MEKKINEIKVRFGDSDRKLIGNAANDARITPAAWIRLTVMAVIDGKEGG